MLLIAVVLGHNRILFQDIPFYFQSIYFWHVPGIFFITFANKGFRNDRANIPDLIVRYMVPFVLFVTAIAGARWLLHPSLSGIGLWAATLAIGSARLCDWSTGLQLFWFLPAQAGFVILSILLARLLRRGAISAGSIVLLLAAMFMLGFFLSPAVAVWVPFGLVLVCFLLPLSAVHSAIQGFVTGGASLPMRALPLFVALVFIAMEAMAIRQGVEVNVAIFKVADPHSILRYLVNAAAAVSAGLFLFLLAPVVARFVPLVRWTGERSMHVYVFHQFIQFPLFMLLEPRLHKMGLPVLVVGGLVVSLFAILFCLAISQLLDRMPWVKQAVFPKDVAALRDTFATLRARIGMRQKQV